MDCEAMVNMSNIAVHGVIFHAPADQVSNQQWARPSVNKTDGRLAHTSDAVWMSRDVSTRYWSSTPT